LKVPVASIASRTRRNSGLAYSGKAAPSRWRSAVKSKPGPVTIVAMPARPSAPGTVTP
jgi:hypothetical protein